MYISSPSFFLSCAQGFSVSSYRYRARRTPAGWQTTPASLCTGELLRWTAAGGAVPEYVHIQWDGCVTVDQKCWVEVVACRCSDVVMGRAQHLSAAGGLEFFIIGDTIDNHLGLFRYVLRKPVVVGRSASQALQYRYVCLVLAAKFLLLFSFLAHVHRFRFCVFTLLRAARVSPETKKRVGPPSVATFFRPTYCCYHDYVLRLERGTGSEPDGAICCIGDSLSLSQEDKHFFFPSRWPSADGECRIILAQAPQPENIRNQKTPCM